MTDSETPPEPMAALVEVLEESQRLGFLGDRAIRSVIAHSRGFVAALEGVHGNVVDLGSGGGVPGLVIAVERPDLTVMMVDRRTKRTDFLERMVYRLGLRDRVEVIAADVERVISERPGSFDAATARGFGPPEVTLGVGLALVRIGGVVVISEPPDGDRWDPEAVASLDGRRVPAAVDGVAVFGRIR